MLAGYIELIAYKTYADLKAENERTYLGFLWWIFEPILFMGVFYLVYGVLLAQGQVDFVAFLLIGLTTWQWLKSCISHGSSTIYGGHALMQHIHLPKVIFPIVLILTDTFKFVFIFVLLLFYLWGSGHPPQLSYLALPLVLLVELLLITAITFWIAAIVPFLPDVRFVVETILQAVFFLSGIFFSADTIPVQYHGYFYLNPMATLIEDYRNVLLHGQWPDCSGLALIGSLSVVGIWLGARLIQHFEYLYPKVTP